ncbi:unnamed protein product [Dovyalis caffra]|uniref:Uncharacterized protein n=1 Tax=Dovyalis caffra TaxID=77055 RepID=A0AAV1RP37_9ROSI|nr:unnamed protein product [Dovyalis caffra]
MELPDQCEKKMECEERNRSTDNPSSRGYYLDSRKPSYDSGSPKICLVGEHLDALAYISWFVKFVDPAADKGPVKSKALPRAFMKHV